jgi:DNA-binding NtrC family response regulator
MTLRILIADDEKAARFGMAKALAGHRILEAGDAAAALAAMRTEAPDLVFLDLHMPGGDGRSVLRQLAGTPLPCRIVVVTASDSVPIAVECLRLGASDYVTKPFEIERIRAIARECDERLALQSRVHDLQTRLDRKNGFGALIGISRPMQELYRQIERVAAADVDVLIRGETGTGKEVVAREIHRLSGRAKAPFVAVNTAAIAETLVESELFGHVKGAFTGAEANRQGCFEQATAGTLFLDEIGDMPLTAQAKILRSLQERVVQPVGSSRSVPVDVRVVSATHQDLDEAMAAGLFRKDLYYRVKGVELALPPLRARREDIVLLADFFLDRWAGSGIRPRLTSAAVDRLLTHPWPGNVRELEHVVTASATLAGGDTIDAADLRLRPAAGEEASPFAGYFDRPLTEAKAELVDAFERAMILEALDRHAGNVSAAARQLGLHRQSLQQKMTQLKIRRSTEGDVP